jgi:hypothetical protein
LRRSEELNASLLEAVAPMLVSQHERGIGASAQFQLSTHVVCAPAHAALAPARIISPCESQTQSSAEIWQSLFAVLDKIKKYLITLNLNYCRY